MGSAWRRSSTTRRRGFATPRSRKYATRATRSAPIGGVTSNGPKAGKARSFTTCSATRAKRPTSLPIRLTQRRSRSCARASRATGRRSGRPRRQARRLASAVDTQPSRSSDLRHRVKPLTDGSPRGLGFGIRKTKGHQHLQCVSGRARQLPARVELPTTDAAAPTRSSCDGNLPMPARPSVPHSMWAQRTTPSRSIRNWPLSCGERALEVALIGRRGLIAVQLGERGRGLRAPAAAPAARPSG